MKNIIFASIGVALLLAVFIERTATKEDMLSPSVFFAFVWVVWTSGLLCGHYLVKP